ncbi:MAG: N-acetylmuramoyl-L-alanine amidase [bacterium]|nr:N-acetylmuramoyl-L-alanine amidase [bacterium]
MSIRNYLIFLTLFLAYNQLDARFHGQPQQKQSFTIMLNPAGDAKHTGRQIGDSFERSITMLYVEQLKQQLENTYPGVSVILTRFPGENVPELQNANFANRLAVDLFVSFHFYMETETKPNLFIYSFSYNNAFITNPADFAFYSYDQAYLFNQKITKLWTQNIYKSLQDYSSLFTVHDTLYFPFKPLIGITSPALAIEASIKETQDWNTYIEPLVHALGSIIKTNIN